MPATPLTIDCRAAANRMAQISNIGGNTQMIHKLVYEDSRTLYDLMTFLLGMGNDAPDESGPGGYYSVTLAQKRVSSVMEGEGNLQLHPLLIASSLDVLAACDFVDAVPSGPVVIGQTVGIQKAVNPVVMMSNPPLDSRIVLAAEVLVLGSGYVRLDGLWWPVTIGSVPLAQFTLVGADTTEDSGTGAGGTISVRP
jgi:hypothetical protein